MLKKLHPDDRSLLILGDGLPISDAALAENPNLDIKMLDPPKLKEIAPEEFDGVVCDLSALHEGLEEILRQMKRVLKPHGWMSAYNVPSLGGRDMLVLKSTLARHFSEVEEDDTSIYAHQERIVERCGIGDFDDVMKVVQAAQPHGLRDWSHARPYVKEKLGHAKAVNLIMREGGRAVGYLMALPQKEAVLEMWDQDPAMPSRGDTYYVMLIATLACVRRKRSQRNLIEKMKEVVSQRFGCHRFSIHARTDSGLTKLIQRRFDGIPKTIRQLEACDYIEASFLNALGEKKAVIANEAKQTSDSRGRDRQDPIAMIKGQRTIY